MKDAIQGSGQALALQPWSPVFDLQHHDREKTNMVSVFRWFHPSKVSKLFQHMETDSRTVLSGLKKGEAGPWCSERVEFQLCRMERFQRLDKHSVGTRTRSPIYSGQFYFCIAFWDTSYLRVNVYISTGECHAHACTQRPEEGTDPSEL